MALFPRTIEQLHTQLEQEHPYTALCDSEVWNQYLLQGSYSGEYNNIAGELVGAPDDAYWMYRATVIMLILVMEGETL